MGCRESLPEYSPPRTVYGLFLDLPVPDIQQVDVDTNTVKQGKRHLFFNLSLQNRFDETLSDIPRDTLGELEIEWASDPAVRRTLILPCPEDIRRRIFNFDPEDSLKIFVPWLYLLDDRGKFVWRSSKTARSGLVMNMNAQARIRLFDRAPEVYSNLLEFRLFIK
ncbi:hypothetical protein JW906_11270 [bacterium]|nr:hypothetical protein [bacterium]